MPQEKLALDRALVSARTKDDAGHLHVSDVPISKATINEYRGNEIPDYDKLGLDPSRRYKLLRDPAELEKGAASFNGKPLLNLHKPQLAADHDHDLTVGSVSGAYFDAPFLKVKDFAVWDGESIADIEQNRQREVSAAYFFDADMTSGVFEGAPYDGVMRNIRGNHVAIVSKGRAGPDCIVSDSALPSVKMEKRHMATKTNLSRRGLLASGAMRAYLRSKLAMDASIDVSPMFKGVTAKNWKASKPKIAAALKAATTGKLAQDADLADVIEMLDQLDEVVDDMPDEITSVAPKDDEKPTEDSDDAKTIAALKAMLKVKGVSDEEIEKALSGSEMPAMDDKIVPKSGEKKPEEKKDTVSRPAMDAAIASAVKATEAGVIARMKAIRDAESAVRPIIGELAMAQDSADDVYRLALDHAKISYDGVDPSAFPALIAMHKQHMADAPRQRATPSVAMDAASVSDREKRFPNGNRLAS